MLFGFGSSPDFKNSSMDIADIDQGGLGLPDRDYYLNTDARSVELREKYLAHVQKMLGLLGEPANQAASDAQAILRLETALAKGSLDRVSRRDPGRTYHKLPLADLSSLAPGFDWPRYFKAQDTPPFSDLNVSVPDFFKAMDAAVAQTSLDDLKTYMRWHLVHAEASLLPKAFVDEDFAFYGKILTGAERVGAALETLRRGGRLATWDSRSGSKFVDQAFGAEGKARTLKMVEEIEKTLNDDIQSLTWMTPATKEQALIKLRAVTNKIGYPGQAARLFLASRSCAATPWATTSAPPSSKCIAS